MGSISETVVHHAYGPVLIVQRCPQAAGSGDEQIERLSR